MPIDLQTALFQPVGGMGRIGEAFGRELGPLIRYHAKVTEIHQDAQGVSVSYEDTGSPGSKLTAQCGLVPVHHSAVDPCRRSR